MHKFYVPKLKSIVINNYDLYNNGEPLSYTFVDGLNLLIGGNGTGKTTFISIIQYALCGAYSGKITIRRSRNEKNTSANIFKTRGQYPPYYFRNRMLNQTTDASVELTFTMAKNEFIVNRSLFTNKLNYFILNGNKFNNDTNLKQYNYEKDRDKKISNIYTIYESKITELSNYNIFCDFIEFITNCITFDEKRKTFLWDYNNQIKLLNRYTAPLELQKKYNEAYDSYKLNDSRARHESENAKPLRRLRNKFIENQKKSINNSHNKKDELINKIYTYTDKIDHQKRSLSKLVFSLEDNCSRHSQYISTCNKIENEISKLSKERNNLLKKIYSTTTTGLHSEYLNFKNLIQEHKECPMCSSDISKITDDSHCFLCNSELKLKLSQSSTTTLKSLDNTISEFYTKLTQMKNSIKNIKTDINEKNSDINKLRKSIDENNRHLRKFNSNLDAFSNTNNTPELTLIENQIKDYEYKINDFKNISYTFKTTAEEIQRNIDKHKLDATLQLSAFFSNYVFKFLKTDAELRFSDDSSIQKKIKEYNLSNNEFLNNFYIPIINNSIRFSEYELSESQRFFVDQSFRFSIFDYFNTDNSLFICETPSSSLDISFEINAANVYLNYINDKNSTLIISANFNKTDFLKYLIRNANKINYINFFKVGRINNVQKNNEKLKDISEELEAILNERFN